MPLFTRLMNLCPSYIVLKFCLHCPVSVNRLCCAENPHTGEIAMQLPAPLLPGRLLRRYKRFLADIELDDGRTVTAHCPNSGSMQGCAAPGSPVLVSTSSNPARN